MAKKYRKVRIMARRQIMKTARIKQNYSVAEFARLVQTTRAHIYLIEKGDSGVSEKLANKIATQLSMELNDLFEIVWPEKSKDDAEPTYIDRHLQKQSAEMAREPSPHLQ